MEKRQFSRVHFNTNSQLIIENKICPLKLINVSLKGALFNNVEGIKLAQGTEGILEIKLPNSNVKIRQHAKLMHSREDKLGFQFLASDLESLTHLRKLLEYNTSQPEKIKEEIALLFNKKTNEYKR